MPYYNVCRTHVLIISKNQLTLAERKRTTNSNSCPWQGFSNRGPPIPLPSVALTSHLISAQKHSGWVSVLHPEGVLYFFHETKVCAQVVLTQVSYCDSIQRIFTDAHIYDEKIFNRLNSHLKTIEDFLDDIGHHENLIGQCDLVLDLVHKDFDKWDQEKGTYDGDYDCTYYFVDHQTKVIFWLDPFSANNFETGVQGVNCKTHLRKFKVHRLYIWSDQVFLGHEMEAQYWYVLFFLCPLDRTSTDVHRYHCQLFPSSIQVSRLGIQELRDIILHNLAGITYKLGIITLSWPPIEDTLTRSHNSTSPFGHEELNRALKWVNSLESRHYCLNELSGTETNDTLSRKYEWFTYPWLHFSLG